MMQTKQVLVQSYKYDRAVHYSWQARLLADDGNLLVTYSQPGYLFTHPRAGVRTYIERPQISYFWRDNWFNVNANFTLAGVLRNYYCNISLPAEYTPGAPIRWVDLDLDLRVYSDLTYTVLDEDEFALHSELYSYPLELREQARAALNDLSRRAAAHAFPFDGSMINWLDRAQEAQTGNWEVK